MDFFRSQPTQPPLGFSSLDVGRRRFASYLRPRIASPYPVSSTLPLTSVARWDPFFFFSFRISLEASDRGTCLLLGLRGLLVAIRGGVLCRSLIYAAVPYADDFFSATGDLREAFHVSSIISTTVIRCPLRFP